jgi:hypothetical protein
MAGARCVAVFSRRRSLRGSNSGAAWSYVFTLPRSSPRLGLSSLQRQVGLFATSLRSRQYANRTRQAVPAKSGLPERADSGVRGRELCTRVRISNQAQRVHVPRIRSAVRDESQFPARVSANPACGGLTDQRLRFHVNATFCSAAGAASAAPRRWGNTAPTRWPRGSACTTPCTSCSICSPAGFIDDCATRSFDPVGRDPALFLDRVPAIAAGAQDRHRRYAAAENVRRISLAP